MPDKKIYKAGETVAATLTLEPGHAVPTQVWLSLDLQPEFGTPRVQRRKERIADLTLQAAFAGPATTVPASPAGPLTLTVRAIVPNNIVGGVYTATSALFFMPDGSRHRVAQPDPDGDYRRHIADDPPVTFDTPVITDLN